MDFTGLVTLFGCLFGPFLVVLLVVKSGALDGPADAEQDKVQRPSSGPD
jgi:hypothetical protein